MKDIVIQAFLEMHTEEHTVRTKPDECPCCEMSTTETRETFRIILNDEMKPIVEGFLEQWQRLAYPIANREEVPDGLAVALTDIVMKFVRPGVRYEEFEPEDIQNHPYVKEKYDEVKNKK
jgi:hypothetical protein